MTVAFAALVFVLAGRKNAVQPKNNPQLRHYRYRWRKSADDYR